MKTLVFASLAFLFLFGCAGESLPPLRKAAEPPKENQTPTADDWVGTEAGWNDVKTWAESIKFLDVDIFREDRVFKIYFKYYYFDKGGIGHAPIVTDNDLNADFGKVGRAPNEPGYEAYYTGALTCLNRNCENWSVILNKLKDTLIGSATIDGVDLENLSFTTSVGGVDEQMGQLESFKILKVRDGRFAGFKILFKIKQNGIARTIDLRGAASSSEQMMYYYPSRSMWNKAQIFSGRVKYDGPSGDFKVHSTNKNLFNDIRFTIPPTSRNFVKALIN